MTLILKWIMANRLNLKLDTMEVMLLVGHPELDEASLGQMESSFLLRKGVHNLGMLLDLVLFLTHKLLAVPSSAFNQVRLIAQLPPTKWEVPDYIGPCIEVL